MRAQLPGSVLLLLFENSSSYCMRSLFWERQSAPASEDDSCPSPPPERGPREHLCLFIPMTAVIIFDRKPTEHLRQTLEGGQQCGEYAALWYNWVCLEDTGFVILCSSLRSWHPFVVKILGTISECTKDSFQEEDSFLFAWNLMEVINQLKWGISKKDWGSVLLYHHRKRKNGFCGILRLCYNNKPIFFFHIQDSHFTYG